MSAITEDDVKEALKDIIGPELGYNIVDLGLIYGVAINGDNTVEIIMTMTIPDAHPPIIVRKEPTNGGWPRTASRMPT